MTVSKELDFLLQSVKSWFDRPEQLSHYANEAADGPTKAEQALLDTLPGAGSVLDIGCGAGRISLWLAGDGYTVTGVDVSEGLLSAARELAAARRAQVDFIAVEGTILPFPDGTFDVLIGFKLLCYIPTRPLRQAYLRELHRVLKRGGTLLMTQSIVPDECIDEARDALFDKSPASRFRILEQGDTFPSGVGYVRWFTESELEEELRPTDFVIEWFESDEAYDGAGYLRLVKLKKE